VEPIRFIFWEGVKILGLVLLGLVSAKALAGLVVRKPWIKPALYALLLALVGLGAWEAGNDVAAEVYLWTANSNLNHGDLSKAYSNAVQAVNLRPNNLSYWHALIRTKMRLQQLQSAMDDQPAMLALSNNDLDEVDEYQFALCLYGLGQNDEVVASTLRLIRQNPSYAAPYVLQGLAYTAEKRYPEAQQSFLAVLQIFPSNQTAVEGLARAFYLAGDHEQARAVLDATQKVQFLPAARHRFEALKGLYDQ
jgi:tetratricopeptide (TPR) repeat protein